MYHFCSLTIPDRTRSLSWRLLRNGLYSVLSGKTGLSKLFIIGACVSPRLHMFEIRYTLFPLLLTREPWPSLAYQKGFLVVVGAGPVKYLVHQCLSLAAKTGSFPILLQGHASRVHQSRRAARVTHLWTRRFHPTKHCFGVLCRTAFHSTPGPGICTNTPLFTQCITQFPFSIAWTPGECPSLHSVGYAAVFDSP